MKCLDQYLEHSRTSINISSHLPRPTAPHKTKAQAAGWLQGSCAQPSSEAETHFIPWFSAASLVLPPTSPHLTKTSHAPPCS